MPPKKKKVPKNAFYFFMMEWKAEKEEQGQRFTGLKEVSELCAEDWKYLPEFNKKKYKDMEKEAKGRDKDDMSNKYNAQGVSLDLVEKVKNEKVQAHQQMINDITSTLKSLSANVEALKSHHFYLAHTNVYCYFASKQVYIPCEVAISKFNLKDGLVDSYHVFPAPFTEKSEIPLGYAFDVRTNKENVHEIPEPSEFDKLEYDWQKIRDDIYEFLLPDGGYDLPPVYTLDGDNPNVNCHMTAVKDFFECVSNNTGDKFRVYNLTLLFFHLYATCQEFAATLSGDTQRAFPVEGVAQQQLMKDIYNYSKGISCSFHENTQHYHNCSVSFVKRWVFLICEYCCQPLGIQILPGRHCLTTSKVTMSHVPHQQPVSKPPAASSREGFIAGDNYLSDEADDDDERWSAVNVHRGMKNLSVGGSSSASGGWNTAGRGQQLAGAWGGPASGQQSAGAWVGAGRGQQIAEAWSPGSRNSGQAGLRNTGADRKAAPRDAGDILIIDHAKRVDESQTKILKTGQASNVVSEHMPGGTSVRRPTTQGRGELMARALQQSPGSLSTDDFPAIGAGKPGRLAKPLATGWGRGFLKQ